MRIKLALPLLLIFAGAKPLLAQDIDTLLNEQKPKKEYVTASFKSTRIIMTHSIEMLKPGILDFRILHRFGNVNSGAGEFFGLDQATIRLGLDYGISNNFTIGIGRGNYRKELDGFLKYRLIQQATGIGASPISLVLAGGTTLQTAKWVGAPKDESFSNRLGYYGQILAGRKFSENLTLQLTPTIVHRNLVPIGDPNDMYALGAGGRIKLSHRVSFNVDYYMVFNKDKSIKTYNPLSIGFDIETGGHVFQLHLTNAIGMNERAFITETTNRWSKGDIQFGFNISRAFQVKKRKF